MESCFSRFKAELLEDGVFESMEDAQTEIFEYIEMYYNPIRRHSSLGYISPVAFEKKNIKRESCGNMDNSTELPTFPHDNSSSNLEY